MPFRASAASGAMRASDVLLRGAGDCHSKGILFAALCRAAGLPARLLIVRLRPRFLDGLLAHPPADLAHVVGQVPQGLWDGRRDCLHQFAPADVLGGCGVFDEPMQFYRQRRAPAAGWLGGLKHAAGVHLLNRCVRTVRRGGPGLLSQPFQERS